MNHKAGGGRNTGGFTFIEMTISIVMFALVSAITIGGMLAYAKVAKSFRAQQRVEETARSFEERLFYGMTDCVNLTVSGGGTVLQLVSPSNVITQYIYVDSDSNNDTIGNNTLFRRVTANSDVGRVPEVTWCSRVTSGTTTLPVFTSITGSARPLVQMVLRSGDRSPNKAANAARVDDLLTGPGYQSFTINTFLTPAAN
ncbi:MAG: hypothetical protein K1X53_07820 [Candidatus Sumerlaeaceae bacterium]|nr:hypothetical protein [Candidatus Sumerlaeaceae bacterium]